VQNYLLSSFIPKNINIKVYSTIILAVVLFGCETWSLRVGEKHMLRVFENRVLRRIFGPKRDNETGEWRKIHNEELSALYSLPNIIQMIKSRRMKWAEHVARIGARAGAYRILVRIPDGKRQIGRSRSK
jgi:hypothetical protein